MDLDKLKELEDHGVAAVRALNKVEKYAALETLLYDLGLRPLTQISIPDEKLRAFKKLCEV
jgi:hypothetical protein